MVKKITSIEELAILTQKEFLGMGQRFDRLEVKVDGIVDVLDVMRADLHDIKTTLGPLAHTVVALEETVRGLDKRVTRLEETAGLVRVGK